MPMRRRKTPPLRRPPRLRSHRRPSGCFPFHVLIELQRVELRIHAAERDELCVTPLFDEPSFVHDEDPILSHLHVVDVATVVRALRCGGGPSPVAALRHVVVNRGGSGDDKMGQNIRRRG